MLAHTRSARASQLMLRVFIERRRSATFCEPNRCRSYGVYVDFVPVSTFDRYFRNRFERHDFFQKWPFGRHSHNCNNPPESTEKSFLDVRSRLSTWTFFLSPALQANEEFLTTTTSTVPQHYFQIIVIHQSHHVYCHAIQHHCLCITGRRHQVPTAPGRTRRRKIHEYHGRDHTNRRRGDQSSRSRLGRMWCSQSWYGMVPCRTNVGQKVRLVCHVCECVCVRPWEGSCFVKMSSHTVIQSGCSIHSNTNPKRKDVHRHH